jgi:hypothetical protein
VGFAVVRGLRGSRFGVKYSFGSVNMNESKGKRGGSQVIFAVDIMSWKLDGIE